MKNCKVLAVMVIMVALIGGVVRGLAQAPQIPRPPQLGSLSYVDIQGGDGPALTIPKGWRLVTVTTVADTASMLWFQGPDGTVYMLYGSTGPELNFRLRPQVSVLRTDQK